MTGNILRLLAAAGFAAAVLLPAGGALADQCGKSHRAAPPSCVTWWYEGDWDWYKGSWHYKKAYAKNNCEGEMVLKIDIAQGGSDDRWHLDYGEEKRETYGKYIRDVRCCTRMGDGCDQSAITSTSCEDKYRLSSAALTCHDEYITQTGGNCSIKARCDTSGGRHLTAYDAPINSMDELQNCNGHLKIDFC